MDEITEEGAETVQVLDNSAEEEEQDRKSFFEQFATSDPFLEEQQRKTYSFIFGPDYDYERFDPIPAAETDVTNRGKTQVLDNSSAEEQDLKRFLSLLAEKYPFHSERYPDLWARLDQFPEDVYKLFPDFSAVPETDGTNRGKTQVLDNSAEEQDQDRKSFSELCAAPDPFPDVSNDLDDYIKRRKAQAILENCSSSDKSMLVLRKGVFAVCTGLFETVLDHKMRQHMEHIELMYEVEHTRQSLTIGNKIFTSIPMVIVRNGKKEGLFVEAEQLKYDNVTTSPNDKQVFVLRNNVLKVWNAVQTVDLEIPSYEPIKLVYEAEHRRQSMSAGNKIFGSTPVVLVGFKGKEVLFVEVSGQHYKENKASGGTNNVRLFSSVDLEANFSLPQQKDLSLKAYGSYVFNNMVNTPQKQNTVGGLIALFCGLVVQPLTGIAITNPLNFHVRNTTNTLLTSGEAVLAHSSEMSYIILLMTCYIAVWMLVWLPIPLAWQLVTIVLLVFTPLFYILQLVFTASSSGVVVACGGSLNLPLIGFAVLGSFGIALIFVLIALLINYSIWRFIYKGDPPSA